MAKLVEITGKALSGEWGRDDGDDIGIPILRTTNFTNEGFINYENVVTRIIVKKNIEEKFLRHGDIIIEKSGGSDKQPVGRVVFFDGPEHKYLFNNFTGLLRIKDKAKWEPKYVFYSLYSNYKKGGTKAFENKTTGLHNLKTDDYVLRYEVKDRSIKEQKSICEKLDMVCRIIKLQEQQISNLDTLTKSRFVEMFGDISDEVTVGYYINALTAGKSLAGEVECKNEVLKTGASTYDFFDETQVKNLPIDYIPSPEHLLKDEDIIISRMNTAELVGATAYVWKAPENTYLPDRLWRAELNHNCNPIFIWQMLIQTSTKEQIRQGASGTSGSMKNISKQGLLSVKVKKVPIDLQNRFAAFVRQTTKLKLVTPTAHTSPRKERFHAA